MRKVTKIHQKAPADVKQERRPSICISDANKTSKQPKKKKIKSPEHFIELSEANRCDEDTACGAAGHSVVPVRRRAEPNQTKERWERNGDETGCAEGGTRRSSPSVSDSLQKTSGVSPRLGRLRD